MGRERRAYEGEERVVSSAIVFGRSQMSDPFFQSKSTVESLKRKKMPFTFGTYVIEPAFDRRGRYQSVTRRTRPFSAFSVG